MEGRGGHDTYPKCKHIPRTYSKEVTEEETLGLLGGDSGKEDVLPLYERKISDYKRIKLCSLQTNELLKCRWKKHVQHIEGLKRYPFKFPNLGDLHFHNYEVKFMPSLTPINRPTFRIEMGVGPGVDKYGQIPIPNDMYGSVANISKTKPIESSKANQH